MAMAPFHPIPLSAVLRVTHQTAHAASWASERWDRLTRTDASLLAGLSDMEQGAPATDRDAADSKANALKAKMDADPSAKRDAAISKALGEITVVSEPRYGGPLGVVEWTGPGMWTDAVITYLRNRWGCEWTELKGMTKPMRVGDVVVLPITGFSPGVGNFGAGEPSGK